VLLALAVDAHAQVMVDTAQEEGEGESTGVSGVVEQQGLGRKDTGRHVIPLAGARSPALVRPPQGAEGGPGLLLKSMQPQQQQQQTQQQTQQQQQQQDGLHLRFVLSPAPTPASQLLVARRLAALAARRAQQAVSADKQVPSQQQQQQSDTAQPSAIEVRGLYYAAVPRDS
jgi:hypothetical protein